jgi:hypothetical protein
LQEPNVLTTSRRSDYNFYTELKNKHLTPAKGDQFIPAKGDQDHWFFHYILYEHIYFVEENLMNKAISIVGFYLQGDFQIYLTDNWIK